MTLVVLYADGQLCQGRPALDEQRLWGYSEPEYSLYLGGNR